MSKHDEALERLRDLREQVMAPLTPGMIQRTLQALLDEAIAVREQTGKGKDKD